MFVSGNLVESNIAIKQFLLISWAALKSNEHILFKNNINEKNILIYSSNCFLTMRLNLNWEDKRVCSLNRASCKIKPITYSLQKKRIAIIYMNRHLYSPEISSSVILPEVCFQRKLNIQIQISIKKLCNSIFEDTCSNISWFDNCIDGYLIQNTDFSYEFSEIWTTNIVQEWSKSSKAIIDKAMTKIEKNSN